MAPVPKEPSAVAVQAAKQAILAPSIHNTQPWRFRLTPSSLEIYADPSRRLEVLDPRGRQLVLSCGAAVFNARVAMAAAGQSPIVMRYPDPEQPTLVARIVVGPARRYLPLADLEPFLGVRHTNRRAFAPHPVPRYVIETLIAAAAAEKTSLISIERPDDRRRIAALARHADDVERADPSYIQEVKMWTTDDPCRPDGVQVRTIPYLAPERSSTGDPVPIRAFDYVHMGWLPTSSQSTADQTLLLLATHGDDRVTWLRAGEAMQRVWLELTRHGLWASPLSQVVEVAETHAAMRGALGIAEHPQLLLRVGKAPSVDGSPRRTLTDLLTEDSLPATSDVLAGAAG